MKTIFNDGFKTIYDCNITDYWGHKVYPTTIDNKFSGCIAKNQDYNKERRLLDKTGYKNVISQKWLEVINFKPAMINKMKMYFDISNYYINEKWVICD